MIITRAEKDDLPEILNLQYAAYQSEAKLLNNYDIPPLKQTLQEIQAEYCKGVFLKALDEHACIIGSVRGYVQDNTLYIGKLMVDINRQRKGIGTALLQKIAEMLPHKRCELFTSSKSVNNLRLYEKLGYKIFQEKKAARGLNLIYLEKKSDKSE